LLLFPLLLSFLLFLRYILIKFADDGADYLAQCDNPAYDYDGTTNIYSIDDAADPADDDDSDYAHSTEDNYKLCCRSRYFYNDLCSKACKEN
jgi:hypothetical protein